jgi:hypothetical protein
MRILIAILLSLGMFAVPGDGAKLYITGEYDAMFDDATASVAYISFAKTWAVQLRSPKAFRNEHGYGFLANLFFSRTFAADTGTYPVQFSYLNDANVFGASLAVMGKGRKIYSHDTRGEVVLSTVTDSRLAGTFRFVVFDGGESEEHRQSVAVTGSFDCERGEALKPAAPDPEPGGETR